MAPILINKDMCEPSYNDLKFTVQNCNYICTNLIALSGLWRSSRALPKAKLAPKKGHGHCLVVCWLIHYSSLNPSGTTVSEKYAQQIGEMHRHLQQPAASTGQQEGPDASPRQRLTAHRTTDTPKVERTGLQRFASPATFPWLLANQLPLLQASPQRLQGKHFHNQQDKIYHDKIIKFRGNL